MHDECNVAHVDTRNVGLKELIMQAHWKPLIVYFSLIFLSEISTFAHHNTSKTIKKEQKKGGGVEIVGRKRSNGNKNVGSRPAWDLLRIYERDVSRRNVSFYGWYCYTFFYPIMCSVQKEDQGISKTKM